MIRSIKFIEGFPLNLPCIGAKTFNFTSGINVLYGTNGTGKSVILNTIKAYCGIEKGGWSKINDPAAIGTAFLGKMREAEDFPHAYKQLSPSMSKANVDWDGIPSFFNDGDIKVSDTFFFQNIGQSSDGITSEEEQFESLINKPSSGQYRASKINKILNMIKQGIPYSEIDTIPTKYSNRMAAERELSYWRFLRKFKNGSVPTILLDEPERALSLPRQKDFFLGVIPELLKDKQVIMATHSPFALFIPNANIIEMEDGYKNECLESFKILNTLCT